MLELLIAFTKIGVFTFGGGMVMVAMFEQEFVANYGWLTHREFVDGIAMGQITPGPVMITSVFIGYKVAGLLGSVVALGSICFIPFVLTIATASQLQRIKGNLRVRAFLKGVSPAVVGMIMVVAFTIARTSVTDIWTALLAVAALVAMVRFKVDTALVVLASGAIGYFLM